MEGAGQALRPPSLTHVVSVLSGVNLYSSHSRRGKVPSGPLLGLRQNLAKDSTGDSPQGPGETEPSLPCVASPGQLLAELLEISKVLEGSHEQWGVWTDELEDLQPSA